MLNWCLHLVIFQPFWFKLIYTQIIENAEGEMVSAQQALIETLIKI